MVGSNAHILEKTGQTVSVSGFTDALGKSLLVDVVHEAVVYDCDKMGRSVLLLHYNTLYVPSMSVCLFNPFIMRLAGIQVDDGPEYFATIPSIVNLP